MITYSLAKINTVKGFDELSTRHWMEFNQRPPQLDPGYIDYLDALVVLDNGTLIGYILYKCIKDQYEEGNTCVIDMFYLAPEYRGNGIGNTMFKVVENTARNQGCRQVKASYNNKLDLEDFYSGLGYENTHVVVKKEI